MRSLWLVPLVLLATAPELACGHPEGQLTLKLLRPGFEDPFPHIDELWVRVLSPDLEPLFELDPATASSGVPFEMGLLEATAQRIEVQGRGGGLLRARGITRLLVPSTGEPASELLPFSRRGSAAAAPIAELGSAQLDGSLAEWQLSPSLMLDASSLAGGPGPDGPGDLRAELYLASSETELRFAVQVTDSCPALQRGSGPCGDSPRLDRLALGIDGRGDGGTEYGSDDLWAEIEPGQLRILRGPATPADLTVLMAPLPDGTGWVAEGSLRLAALGRGPLRSGDRIGLELIVVDEDPGQTEPTRLSWSGAGGAAPTPPSQMGRVGPGKSGP